jgi:hypothetical protein
MLVSQVYLSFGTNIHENMLPSQSLYKTVHRLTKTIRQKHDKLNVGSDQWRLDISRSSSYLIS